MVSPWSCQYKILLLKVVATFTTKFPYTYTNVLNAIMPPFNVPFNAKSDFPFFTFNVKGILDRRSRGKRGHSGAVQ